jgi:hypothetical protein
VNPAAAAAVTDCTPGHTEGDPACEQVADGATALAPLDVSGTPLPVGVDYPCGWDTGTTWEFDDRFQANAIRSSFGNHGDAYVEVQIRAYTEPVEAGFLESTRSQGHYETVAYDYAGESRTALVTAADHAAHGTLGHAVIPFLGALVHVELVSTLESPHCGVDPRPDNRVVREMLASLGPTPGRPSGSTATSSTRTRRQRGRPSTRRSARGPSSSGRPAARPSPDRRTAPTGRG